MTKDYPVKVALYIDLESMHAINIQYDPKTSIIKWCNEKSWIGKEFKAKKIKGYKLELID